jgi:bifunctional non-homologous end joining protein LigD
MLKPMLASLAEAPLVDRDLVYEPKYDGIRALVEIGTDGSIVLWSRLGNNKTGQFPEVGRALANWVGGRHRPRRLPLLVDGEIVALDASGAPGGFQQLQRRMHTTPVQHVAPDARVAIILFDLLRVGHDDLTDRPLDARRAALERLVRTVPEPLRGTIRLSEAVRGDGRALYARAVAGGWEGLVAKRADSKYRPGARTPDWRKLKIVREQELVVCGWTEPRDRRLHLGALLLGVYQPADDRARPDGGRTRSGTRGRPGRAAHSVGGTRGSSPALVYVGSVGTGFDERERQRLITRLRPLETADCPFAEEPTPNERPHWVRPALVAQVKFTEWTADGKLRHPVYLGLRDDKPPAEITREADARLHSASRLRLDEREARPSPAPLTPPSARPPARRVPAARGAAPAARPPARRVPPARPPARRVPAARVAPSTASAAADPLAAGDASLRAALTERLHELETAGRDGRLDLGDGRGVAVTNLRKIFWPGPRLTKGDLFRYYVTVAPCLLPAIADRPLVMKRFPNGVAGAPFYQHRVADVPPGVRVAPVRGPGARRDGRAPGQLQIVGGDLLTLLYTTQLASISQDPWFSRVMSITDADYVALDLDPADGVSFRQVLDVARWIRDEIAPLGATGVPKTSGADGLHVYIPLPPGTPYDAGLLFCEIVATIVARKHPQHATIERAVRKRGRRVYVDYLQNSLGKTLASAYSARASAHAGVSTPLTWDEVDRGVSREDFTIRTVPGRLREAGDLWALLRSAAGVDLEKASRHWSRPTTRRR